MQPAIRIEQDDGDRRVHAPRTLVGHVTTVRSPVGHPQDVTVLDLSARGLLYQAGSPLPVGTAIAVGLAGAGSAEAIIVRRDGDRYGAAFRRPLTPRQLVDAFAGGAVHSLFAGAADALSLTGTQRWPRPIRALVVIAAAVLAWGGVAAVRMIFTGAIA